MSAFATIGRLSVRHRYLVVAAWIAGAALAIHFLPSLASAAKNDNSAFLPAGQPSMRAARLAAPFQRQHTGTAQLVVASASGALTAADDAAIDGLEGQLRAMPRVLAVRDQGESLDRRARKAQIDVATAQFAGERARSTVNAMRARFRDLGRQQLEAHLTGALPLLVDRARETSNTRHQAQSGSFLFIVALLLIVFRAVLAPIVTLLPAALSLAVAGPLIAEASKVGVQVSELTQILLVVLVLGAGTDYGLFLIFRVREEMTRGLSSREAVAVAVARVGETITFSAATVIAALLSLLLTDFGLYRGLGPGLAIGIATVLVAGLTLLPALLSIAGRAAFWPTKPRPGAEYRGAWGAVAARVVRRPLATLVAGVAVFAGLSLGLIGYSPAGFGGQKAPSASDSARGDALLAAHFPAADRNPNNLVFHFRAPVWRDPAELVATDRSLRSDRVFSAISGPLDPYGVPLPPSALARLHDRLVQVTRLVRQRRSAGTLAMPASVRTLAQFVSLDGRTVQFYATLAAGDPSSTQAMRAIPAARAAGARAAAAGGALDAGVAGQAAAARDVSTLSTGDLARVIPVVLVIIALLLAVLLRSAIAPLYLIVSVGLSYLAALGLAVLAFVVVGGNSGINFVLPFFMFIFLMALGEDYNILVMSRIREEAQRSALAPAVRRAIAATGGTVTSAGLVLAGTFAVLTLTGNSQTREIGLGLAAGVLLDTFLVRTLLIPSTVVLVGRWNWWPSRLSPAEPADTPTERVPAGVG